MLSEIIGNMINDSKVTISKTQGYALSSWRDMF